MSRSESGGLNKLQKLIANACPKSCEIRQGIVLLEKEQLFEPKPCINTDILIIIDTEIQSNLFKYIYANLN